MAISSRHIILFYSINSRGGKGLYVGSGLAPALVGNHGATQQGNHKGCPYINNFLIFYEARLKIIR
jgi:hypothetical protein